MLTVCVASDKGGLVTVGTYKTWVECNAARAKVYAEGKASKRSVVPLVYDSNGNLVVAGWHNSKGGA